jgi:hypothetical protein
VTLSGGRAKYTFTIPAAEGEIAFTGTVNSDAKIVPPIQGDQVSATAMVKATSVGATSTPVIPFGADEVDAATVAVSQLASTITTLTFSITNDLKTFSDFMAKL